MRRRNYSNFRYLAVSAALIGLHQDFRATAQQGQPNPPTTVTPKAANAPEAVAALSDEFSDATSAQQWRHVYRDEKSPANQLELFDINTATPGCLSMMPFTSSWYRDYRGVLVYKPVPGDFAITTRVYVTGRDRRSAPQGRFSLAGLMMRAPRDVTPETWRPGGENYVFLSLGSATKPGAYQFEFKTTTNSDSKLTLNDAGISQALLQIARIGPHFLLLTQSPDAGWTVRGRYYRPDLPETLQAGITTYTDWPNCERLPAAQHNQTVIRQGNPDLYALFDWVRYRAITVPAALRDKALSDPRAVSDDELLQFLGSSPAADP